MIQNEEFIDDFLLEANQHMDTIEHTLLTLEDEEDFEKVNDIFRAIHSIKGTAGFFGLSNIVDLSHAMENVFGEIRKQKLKPNKAVITHSITALDLLKHMIADLQFSETLDLTEVIHNLNQLIFINSISPEAAYEFMDPYNQIFKVSNIHQESMANFVKENFNFYAISLGINHHLSLYEGGPIKMFHRIEAIGSLLDTQIDCTDIKSLDHVLIALENGSADVHLRITLASKLEKNDVAVVVNVPKTYIVELTLQNQFYIPEKTDEKEMKTSETDFTPLQNSSVDIGDESIQVKLSKLDHLMDLIGELVISESIVTQNPEILNLNLMSFQKASRQHRKIILELKEIITDVRLIPLTNLFHKMKRVVRDVSIKLNKDVEIEIIGDDIEVDKKIAEIISDPLIHLIRNAVDHGIELPQIRKEKNKKETGKIHLKASKTGSEIIICIKDDGKGLNPYEIYQTAYNQNIVYKSFDELSYQEIFNLILEPGFSTKTEVTEYSGRGVGMDVVLKSIQKVGGTISIDSQEGFGTTFNIKLPLTLSIVEGMLVALDTGIYIIPTLNIKNCIIPNQDMIICGTNNEKLIRIGKKTYPIIVLKSYLGFSGEEEDLLKGILIEIENDKGNAIIWVNKIINHQQIVVKKLPKHLKNTEKLSGCTLLGNGKVSLIVDVDQLVNYKN
ncbi:MAG: chemotaxis protein CheA [Clostridia bacterium]|nr:chemotaxis protein CheA [Clostridia bacterium]